MDAAPTSKDTAKTAQEEAEPGYVARLRTEISDLGDKINKLAAFINDKQKFTALPFEERMLLITQLPAMQAYYNILCIRGCRIEANLQQLKTGKAQQ